MKQLPFVSIIIPVNTINKYLFESIPQIKRINYPKFEILIFPDKTEKEPHLKNCRIIPTGPMGPAEKRDLAIKHAKGEVFAFLDDDAFPTREWLLEAIKHFKNPEIAAVGGPGLTPPNVSFFEQASGWVSASPLGAGPYTYRFIPKALRYVDDFPSMNLLVRKSEFVRVGGFDSHYYPGEDTKLCLDLISEGKKIVYDPKVVVFHHRRPLWLPHLRQNGQFGLHRGYFARALPRTSLRVSYMMPSILLVIIFLCILAMIINNRLLFQICFIPLILYGLLLVLNAIWVLLQSKKIALAIISVPAIVITHLWYGIRFLEGYYFTKHLRR